MRRRFARVRGVVAPRLLIAAGLAATLATPPGSGRGGTAALLGANRGSAESASTSVWATAIGAGLIHTCALTSTGGVKCWGYNGHDELGDGTVRYTSTPVDVSGLSSGVTAIAIGSRHGCALASAGGLKCWGYNRYGQLGDGTTVNRPMPVDVSGLSSGVNAIAASFHTCALTSAAGVKCWGSNSAGQLGDGTTEDRSTPVDVSGLSSGVTAIAAGDSHSCALTSSGGLECWGDNSSGQLGDGTTADRWTPVEVSGLSSGVTAIAAGGLHSCALTHAGRVKCWGSNSGGQLGDGTTKSRSTPVGVSGLRAGVMAIAAGLRHGCALTRAGGVKCWGLNDYGQLGDGTPRGRSKPVDVSGLSRGVTAIAAGGLHSCARTSAGGVKCWGRNVEGELGDGREVNRRRLRPVSVVGFGPAEATLAIVSRSVQVTRARVTAIKLHCGESARCKGVLTLSARVRGRLVGSRRSRVNVTLGTHRFSIADGRSATVKVKLTARGFRLLVHVKHLPTQVRIRYAQPDGSTTTAIRTITLIAPKVGSTVDTETSGL